MATLSQPKQFGDSGDVLRNRTVGKKTHLLDDVADFAAQLAGVNVGDVFTLEEDSAVGGLD
jgi:hypothetical protein